jgi:glycosyltransferase involved in cell wall biosynthesis
MDLTYLVNAYERPWELLGCLVSLRQQTHQDFEVIVLDNQTVDAIARENLASLAMMRCEKFRYVRTCQEKPYQASDFGAQMANGEFLCFPSDDSYYVPAFGEKMLAAARGNAWDLVYCDAILRPSTTSPRRQGIYVPLLVEPRMDYIDKTLFIVRKSVFPGFRCDERPYWTGADAYVVEEMVSRGVSHGRVPEPLAVHN